MEKSKILWLVLVKCGGSGYNNTHLSSVLLCKKHYSLLVIYISLPGEKSRGEEATHHALFVTLLMHVTYVFFLILSVKERSSLYVQPIDFLSSFNVCHLRFRSAPCRPVSVQFRLESDTAIRCMETCRKWAREALISRADAALRPAKWQGRELIELAPQSFW